MEVGVLSGRHVRLEPLEARHVPGLVEAARVRDAFGYTAVPAGVDAMAAYVEALCAAAARDEAVPFAQVRPASGEVVGATRYLCFDRDLASGRLNGLEIGGTWLSADARRTGVNTEAKLMLMTHAFEALGVARVQMVTDARNVGSRTAISRLGAAFEGILRSYRLAAGHAVVAGEPRDSAVYSVVRDEWPAVRDALRARLARDAGAS